MDVKVEKQSGNAYKKIVTFSIISLAVTFLRRHIVAIHFSSLEQKNSPPRHFPFFLEIAPFLPHQSSRKKITLLSPGQV